MRSHNKNDPPGSREENAIHAGAQHQRATQIRFVLLGEDKSIIKSIEKRAYELFEDRGRVCGHDWEDWFKAEKELFKPVNVTEKDGVASIRAEVPGFKSDELEISLEPERLAIKSLHQQETKDSESRSRQIFRTLQLPVSVVPEKPEAALNEGVLEINAPRTREAKPQEEENTKLAAA